MMDKVARYKKGLLSFPFFVSFSARRSLLMRLIAINSLGLLAFLIGLLMLGQTRESLTQAYRQSLLVQGHIMAEAVGGVAPEAIQIEQISDNKEAEADMLLPMIDAVEVTKLLRRLVAQTNIRVRYYDYTGTLIVDTAKLPGTVHIAQLDDGAALNKPSGFSWQQILGQKSERLLTDEMARQGIKLTEVMQALGGEVVSLSRRTSDYRDVLTLAVPVRYYRAINGVLMLTSPPGAIDEMVVKSRRATVQLFMVIFSIALVLTIFVARTITMPVQKLSGALRHYQQTDILPELDKIPDYSQRADEIADLSQALRGMLAQLLQRLDAIERFAADVAHELKNPLASMQSAIETLELTKNLSDRQALLDILATDIHRLNRLITDISEASRLDAELGRKAFERLDFSALVVQLTPILVDEKKHNVTLEMDVEAGLFIQGQDHRLAQILQNLLDNALSFAPPQSKIRVSLRRKKTQLCLSVEDEGAGVQPELTERVFERFYTDRPSKAKNKGIMPSHSGLGLSIAREIARMHGGDLIAHATSATSATGATGATSATGGGSFNLFLPLGEGEIST